MISDKQITLKQCSNRYSVLELCNQREQERVEMLKKFIYEETHYTKDCNCILCDERRDLLKEIKKIWGLK